MGCGANICSKNEKKVILLVKSNVFSAVSILLLAFTSCKLLIIKKLMNYFHLAHGLMCILKYSVLVVGWRIEQCVELF